MDAQSILTDLQTLAQDLVKFERKYGLPSATFYRDYTNGQEPFEGQALDFGEWASVYQTWLARQAQHREVLQAEPIVTSDPERMGGAPVFRGTRVPVKTLFDYVRWGYALEEFLEFFPSVSRQDALAVLAEAERLTLRQINKQEVRENASTLLALLRSPEFVNRPIGTPQEMTARIEELRNSWD